MLFKYCDNKESYAIALQNAGEIYVDRVEFRVGGGFWVDNIADHLSG